MCPSSNSHENISSSSARSFSNRGLRGLRGYLTDPANPCNPCDPRLISFAKALLRPARAPVGTRASTAVVDSSPRRREGACAPQSQPHSDNLLLVQPEELVVAIGWNNQIVLPVLQERRGIGWRPGTVGRGGGFHRIALDGIGPGEED